MAGGGYITLHSLDCHVRDVNEKVHLMSDISKVIMAKTVTNCIKVIISHADLQLRSCKFTHIAQP